MQKNPRIEIYPKPVKKNKLYSLHVVKKDEKEFYGKVFYSDVLEKLDLMELIEFNNEAFEDVKDNYFPECFLEIKQVTPHSQGFIFLTEKFDLRLDQFLRKHILSEKQAMIIMEQIIKAYFSIAIAGYWSRNIRPEHFVRVGNVWKLESLVYSEKHLEEGDPSEYLFNKMYQTPEAYDNVSFTDDELTQWAVWNLGCILIHMVTGSHKLKSKSILDRFKNEPFNFEKIGIKQNVHGKFSEEFKSMLGKMCHYNPQKRIKLSELVLSGFFSQQLAKSYTKMKESQAPKIFVSGSSSLSKALDLKKSNTGKVSIPDTTKLNQIKKQEEENIELKISGRVNSKILTEKEFKGQMQDIMEVDESSYQTSAEKSLNEKKFEGIIKMYKNYFDKCKLISIATEGFRKLLTEKAEVYLLNLTKFAILFVKTMDLCALSTAMNQNKKFFVIENQYLEEDFLGTPEHLALKKWVNTLKKSSLSEVQKARDKIVDEYESFLEKEIPAVRDFIETFYPQDSDFSKIKKPYRSILKRSYDMIVDHYSENKTREWAEVGMHITFCMAIDKIYIHDELKDNFKFYFSWAGIAQSDHIQLERFQEYLNNAPRKLLVENSRYILGKFYQV